MTVFCSFVFSVLLISNLEFFMRKFWRSKLEMAGLSFQTNLESLKDSNNELYRQLTKTKKKFIIIRCIIWLIVLRETIVCSMQFIYMLDECETAFYHILNYASRAFLECFIDLIELLGLCWVYRAQQQF
jgi:hypothetical protein